MKQIPIRHGELLLLPITDGSVDMTEAETKTNYIASHSETGHHHVIEGDVSVLEREGQDTVVQLFSDSDIVHKKSHDKHDTLPVAEGIYKLLRKKEYDPFQSVMRTVWD